MSYYNSTIQPKIGLCCDCPQTSLAKPLTAGRCQYHYKIFREEENKKKRRRTIISAKEPVFKSHPDSSLNSWFEFRVLELTGICKDCKKPTSKGDVNFQHFCVAHILPKRQTMFPSVSTHPLNFIELGHWCGCHANYDNKGWEWAATRPYWNFIIFRFKKIYPLIVPEERHRIPDVLVPHIPENNLGYQ